MTEPEQFHNAPQYGGHETGPGHSAHPQPHYDDGDNTAGFGPAAGPSPAGRGRGRGGGIPLFSAQDLDAPLSSGAGGRGLGGGEGPLGLAGSGGSFPGGGRGRGAGRGGFQMGEGDWRCPNEGCGNINFARRNACNICQTPKPGTERPQKKEPGLGGPPGLFKKGDWSCLMCGNVNWERRLECNVCKAPKPGQHIEHRDGVGGGFNERQERASGTKNEVAEDGYDDFGRKKASKREQDRKAKQAAALARLQATYSSINPDVGIPELRSQGLSPAESNGDSAKSMSALGSRLENHQDDSKHSKPSNSRSRSRERVNNDGRGEGSEARDERRNREHSRDRERAKEDNRDGRRDDRRDNDRDRHYRRTDSASRGRRDSRDYRENSRRSNRSRSRDRYGGGRRY